MMKDEDRPSPTARPLSFGEIMGAVRRPEVYLNVPVHLLILIPATGVIAYLAARIDGWLGWERFVSPPLSWILFAILFPAGVFIVWYTYGYLAIRGEGSPATHLGGTKKLVTTGPFSFCRHPSIIGKFLGVVGFGLLIGSPVFFFIIIPLLTFYSLMTARFLQERLCVRLWGENYLRYRESVPLVIPRFRR